MRLRKPLFQKPVSLGHHLPQTRRPAMLGEEIEDESDQSTEEEHSQVQHEAVVGIIDVCAKDEFEQEECEVSAFLMKETFNDELLNHAISVYETAVSEIQNRKSELIGKEPMSLYELEQIQTGQSYKKYQPEDIVVFEQSEWTQKPEEPPEPDEGPTVPEYEEEETEEEETEESQEGLGEKAPSGRFSDDDKNPGRKKRKEDQIKMQVIVGYIKTLTTTGDPVSTLQTSLTALHDEIQNLDGEESVSHANDVLNMIWGEEQGESISVDRAYLYP